VQKDLVLYLFGLEAGKILNIAYILPKSRDDPEAIERTLDTGRTEKIAEFIQKANAYLPNAIILNFDTSKIQFSEFSEDETSAMFRIQLPEPRPADEVKKDILTEWGLDAVPKGGEQRLQAEIEKRLMKIAYVIDGQHRLKGLERAGKLDIPLPVIATKDADVSKAAKIFADINGEQRPVPQNSILLIRYEIGDLPGLVEQATRIAHKLNERAESPFKDKVKIYEQDKGTWLEAYSLQQMLYPIIGTGALQGMALDEQVTHFINYFSALKTQNPVAFGPDRRDYILTQPRGIAIALGVFERVWRRCETYEGGNFDQDSILRQVEILKVMDWKRQKYGQLKGAGGVMLLVDKMKLLLPEKDDRKPANHNDIIEWFKKDELVL